MGDPIDHPGVELVELPERSGRPFTRTSDQGRHVGDVVHELGHGVTGSVRAPPPFLCRGGDRSYIRDQPDLTAFPIEDPGGQN